MSTVGGVLLAQPLAELITAAADGRFPEADGGWRRVPLWRPGLEAIIAFTGHAVLAVAPDIPNQRLISLGVDGFGGAHDPRLITALAGPDGWIDSLDMLMAGRGTGHASEPPQLVGRPDLATHPRAAFAATIRDQVRPMGYPDRSRSALALISRGIAGLTELSFELEPQRRGQGGGAELVRRADRDPGRPACRDSRRAGQRGQRPGATRRRVRAAGLVPAVPPRSRLMTMGLVSLGGGAPSPKTPGPPTASPRPTSYGFLTSKPDKARTGP